LDISFDFLNLLFHLAKRGKIKTLTHERVADTNNFFSKLTAILEHNNKDGLLSDRLSLVDEALLINWNLLKVS
jgi:hypothetical protein